MKEKNRYLILALLMFCFLVFVSENVAAGEIVGGGVAGGTRASTQEYTFTSIDDEKILTKGNGKQVTVLIFGSTKCGNTQATVRGIAGSDWVKSPGIRVLFAEINSASQQEVKNFKSAYGCDEITFCYEVFREINEAWTDYYVQFPEETKGALPHIILIDEKNEARRALGGNQPASRIFAEIQKISDVKVEETDPLQKLVVDGTENYAFANEVLIQINKERVNANAGLMPLKLDQDLVEAAMQRAAELSLYYSHTRPNGEKCTSILMRYTRASENIAVGYLTPSAVMKGWMSSDGHRANILDSQVSKVGVGCFQDNQGRWYWVQYFDNYPEPYVPVAESGSKAVRRTVSIRTSLLNLAAGRTALELGCGSADAEGDFQIFHQNREDGYSRPVLGADNFEFSSSDTSVATVDASGKISVKAPGQAVITAKVKEGQATLCMTVTKKEHSYQKEVVPPTASEKGHTVYTCSVCGHSYTEDGAAGSDGGDPGDSGASEDSGKPGDDSGSSAGPGNGSGSPGGSGDPEDEEDNTEKPGNGSEGPEDSGAPEDQPGSEEGSSASVKKLGDVTGLKASPAEKSVKLTWKKVSKAKGYFVYQYDSAKKKWKKIATVQSGKTSYKVPKLKAGTSYRFAVKAYATQNRKQVTSKTYTSLYVSTKPASVDFQAKAGKGKAVLRWEKVKGASGYSVYYKTSKNGAWKKLGSTKSRSFTCKNLKSGKKYYFTVRAYRTYKGKTYTGSSAEKALRIK